MGAWTNLDAVAVALLVALIADIIADLVKAKSEPAALRITIWGIVALVALTIVPPLYPRFVLGARPPATPAATPSQVACKVGNTTKYTDTEADCERLQEVVQVGAHSSTATPSPIPPTASTFVSTASPTEVPQPTSTPEPTPTSISVGTSVPNNWNQATDLLGGYMDGVVWDIPHDGAYEITVTGSYNTGSASLGGVYRTLVGLLQGDISLRDSGHYHEPATDSIIGNYNGIGNFTQTVTLKKGQLRIFPIDDLGSYGDNSGSVHVTIKDVTH